MPLKVLIASYLEPEFIERIRDAVPQVEVIYRPDLIGAPQFHAHHTAIINRTPQQEAKWSTLLAQADILFDFDHTHREDLPQLAPNLKWIQTTSAGIGQFVKSYGYDKHGWIFSTASGVHARPLAEFCLMAMLMFVKNYVMMDQLKRTRTWQRFNNTELSKQTVGIIGLGKIGSDIARICKLFGMRVIGSRRSVSLCSNGISHINLCLAFGSLLLDAVGRSDPMCHMPGTPLRVISASMKLHTENSLHASNRQVDGDGLLLIPNLGDMHNRS